MGTGSLDIEKLRHVKSVIDDVRGVIVELGVFRGKTLKKMIDVFNDRTIYGFDTFTGMPGTGNSDDNKHYWKSRFNVGGVDAFIQAMAKDGYPQDSYRLVEGTIPESLCSFQSLDIAFAYIDLDTYEHTPPAIQWVLEHLSPGGVIGFDDYYLPNVENGILAAKAIDEFLNDNEVERILTDIEDNDQIFIQLVNDHALAC